MQMSNIAIGNYEPPTVVAGTPCTFGGEGLLAAGVRGYAIEENGRIFIPLIIAEHEGNGDVGRFLDSLSPRCVIPNLTSPRLMGMLSRRGFIPDWSEGVDIWSKV
jgi:hypothetical protein